MYELLSKLAEILSTYGFRFLDGKKTSRDARVAAHLVGVVAQLQDMCGRGARILALTDEFVEGKASADSVREFDQLLGVQVEKIDELRAALEDSRELLVTIDVEFYLELVPFLDQKSGLLTRWMQQVARSRYSTTTLFFLQSQQLRQILDEGRAAATPAGLSGSRTPFLAAVGDQLSDARACEVRDIRRTPEHSEVQAEVENARARLADTRELCSRLHTSIEQAVGADAVADARWKLLPKARKR